MIKLARLPDMAKVVDIRFRDDRPVKAVEFNVAGTTLVFSGETRHGVQVTVHDTIHPSQCEVVTLAALESAANALLRMVEQGRKS